jgi:hypothetical protein
MSPDCVAGERNWIEQREPDIVSLIERGSNWLRSPASLSPLLRSFD